MNKILYSVFHLSFIAHKFHFNIEGCKFQPMHQLFGDIYTMLNDDFDTIGEHLRTKGEKISCSLEEIQSESLVFDEGEAVDWGTMCECLSVNLKTIIERLREVSKDAEMTMDYETVDLVGGLMRQYAKKVWILDSFLVEEEEETKEKTIKPPYKYGN